MFIIKAESKCCIGDDMETVYYSNSTASTTEIKLAEKFETKAEAEKVLEKFKTKEPTAEIVEI